MAIEGPRIQLPTSFRVVDDAGNLLPEWTSFLHSLQQTGFNFTRSGATASRPTSTLEGRWVGMPYFDTTLGYPIWLESVNPDVWVDATGTPA